MKNKSIRFGLKVDPWDFRVFVVVSRQTATDSKFLTITCAPIYFRWHEISAQVLVGTESDIKHGSAIHCDELIGFPKSILNNYVGLLSASVMTELNTALKIVLDIET